MATRIETLGGGRRAPKAAWIVLFAIVMVTAAVAVGTLIRSDGITKTPARSANEAVSTALEPATQVPGLIKAGLQPRLFSPIHWMRPRAWRRSLPGSCRCRAES
jgi:hypothetical protein